jgi:16S rRNA U1498 N3-methylase RsmE
MRLHRFYVGSEQELDHYVWLRDERILYQWQKVLRYRAGQQVILFDGVIHDRLYVISEMKKDAAHLELITDLNANCPPKTSICCGRYLKKTRMTGCCKNAPS